MMELFRFSLKKFLSSDGILVYLLMALRCGISRLGTTNLLNFCYIQKFSKPFLFTSHRNILNPKLELLINEKINEIQKAALDKRIAGKDFTAATLIESTSSKDSSHKTVGEYYLTYIQNLKKEKRIRYAGMLEVSYNSFIKFNRHLDIPFSDIDVAWLKKYELWMKGQNLSVSTISTRIRHLRAVFNLAITEHSIKNDCYPFHTYKVSKLNRQTPKRAITRLGAGKR